MKRNVPQDLNERMNEILRVATQLEREGYARSTQALREFAASMGRKAA